MRMQALPTLIGVLAWLPLSAVGSVAEATPDFDNRIDANRIDLRLSNRGSFGYDIDEGRGDLIYPSGSGISAIFAGGFLIAGKVDGELRVSGAEYAFTFDPGTIVDGVPQDDDADFRIYEITEASGPGDPDYDEWPILDGAPVDVTETPLLLGSETLWSVCHDMGLPRRADIGWASDAPLGIEIRQTSWSYRYTGALDNTVFLRYEVTNGTADLIEDTYFSMFTDPDIGSAIGVLGGCDPSLDLGYAYKESGFDDTYYGFIAPAVGFCFLETPLDGASSPLGLTAYSSYINGTDPTSTEWAYNYMRGLERTGEAVVDPTTEEETPFWYSGDPVAATGWLNDNGVNRKMFVSTGPFTLSPGETETFVVALILGMGGGHIDGVRVLKEHASEIADRFARSEFPALTHVYPGDLDGDGDVDVDDVVPLAMHFGSVGIARRDASLEWSPQPVLEWPDPAVTAADGDGDGVVDMSDLFAIGLNWGQTHESPRAPVRPDVDLSLYVDRLRQIREAVGDGSGDFARAVRALVDPILASAASPPVTLLDASPNPFHGEVTLVYRLGTTLDVRASIVDPAGRRIHTSPTRRLPDGTYTESWNGRDQLGLPVAAGVYFFVLDTDQGRAATRLVRVR